MSRLAVAPLFATLALAAVAGEPIAAAQYCGLVPVPGPTQPPLPIRPFFQNGSPGIVRFSATVDYSDIPNFPHDFAADNAIAVYDTNGNGFIDTIASADSTWPFPFMQAATTATVLSRGRRIGSPGVVGDLTGMFFQGDLLVYAEKHVGSTTFFLWLAFQDPARGQRGSVSPIDFGAGSYTGTTLQFGNAAMHATFVGGMNASRLGDGHAASHDAFGWTATVPAPGGRGSILSVADPNLGTYPQALGSFTAGITNPNISDQNFFVTFSGVTFDVPVLREEDWTGDYTYYTTCTARTISALGGTTRTYPAQYPRSVANQWSTAFADGSSYPPLDLALSVSFADVNGDGAEDLCGRDAHGVLCALAIPGSDRFGTPTRWSSSFESSWSTNEAYWRTIRYVDVNGDGRVDVCGRGAAGIWCALSNGSSFGPVTLWSATFSDANGWASSPSYWKTIRFPDLNGDGRADVCGRGAAGIWCALSNGSGFGPVALWSATFSNANGWANNPAYYETIQFADIDDDGRDDICGRASDGVYCATSMMGWNLQQFTTTSRWTARFGDAEGFLQEKYYATLQLADINGDGAADLCARGASGIYCGGSTTASFLVAANPLVANFTDAYGWDQPQYYKTIRLVDYNGDGRADVCGRGGAGVWCALAQPLAFTFAPAQLVVRNFGDNYGWNLSQTYWGTVQPARPRGGFAASFCGRGSGGIWCSN